MMAIIGFICMLALGGYLLLAGVTGAYALYGLTGNSREAVKPLLISLLGAVVLHFALSNMPFTIKVVM